MITWITWLFAKMGKVFLKYITFFPPVFSSCNFVSTQPLVCVCLFVCFLIPLLWHLATDELEFCHPHFSSNTMRTLNVKELILTLLFSLWFISQLKLLRRVISMKLKNYAFYPHKVVTGAYQVKGQSELKHFDHPTGLHLQKQYFSCFIMATFC